MPPAPASLLPAAAKLLRAVRIVSTARHVPRRCLEGDVLDRKLGLPSGTLEKMSGVRRRYYTDGENAAQLGAQAARAALDRAGLDFADIDLLLCVSGTADQLIPCNAALILQELDPRDRGVTCFDINSTCLSFVAGLDTISYAIAAGRYRRVLLVASELPSLGVNDKELEAYSLFGDAAAAVVVAPAAPGEGSRLLGARLETYPSGADHCHLYGGAGRLPAYHYNTEDPTRYLFHMDGKKIFRQASSIMPGFVERLLTDAGVALRDIDLVVPHQASLAAMELLRRKLGITEDRLVCTLPDYGNNIAASMPLALDVAIEQGRLRRGHKVMLLGTSAGFSIGGLILEY